MDLITSYLPLHDGLLPQWLLFISVVSIGNSVQSYASLAGTRQVYATSTAAGSPITPLSARTFGTWTALSSIVRLYTAYHVDNPVVYELCLWTFGLAFAHFLTEWLVFGTARWGRGLAGPVAVSTATGTWMLMQWAYYVR